MVKVSKNVYDGITAVRDSGKTNMFDYQAVAYYAIEMGYYQAADWIVNNKKSYVEGIFKGFEIS